MIVLRCTSKLARKLGVRPVENAGSSSGSLGDWYATLLRTKRGHFVLSMARHTLLPIVVSGRDLRSFPLRVSETLAELLAAYGVPAANIERECAAMFEVQYARTDDRSNVGVLTEFQRLLQWELEASPNAPLLATSLRLAQTPIVARDTFPADATCALFGVPPPRRRVAYGN